MWQLPAAMASFGAFRQFIVCQYVPDPAVPGKTHKYPINIHMGERKDAHDPAIWVDFATASAVAQAWGDVPDINGVSYGVGFVFTTADPFWFIDVDNCAIFNAQGVHTGWTPIVAELCAAFPGAAVEISHSGRGLHLFGTGTAPEHRRCKDKTGQLFDLYTEGRFAALTGTAIYGDASTEHTPALYALTEKHLHKDPSVVGTDDWTDGPCAEWYGPTDDVTLIKRMMNSKTTANSFGTRASFAELWTADVEALSKFYPDDHGHKPYDESKADAALAQHLAFWTGRDCVRIERLMRQSALARPKWDDRDDYLNERTIMGAVGRQGQVLIDKKPEPLNPGAPALTAPAGTGQTAQPTIVTGSTILNTEEQIRLFTGCVYVMDIHRILIPGGRLLKPDQFKVAYGGYSMVLDENDKISRCPWETFTQSQRFRAPRTDTTCFKPDRAPGEIIYEAGQSRVNVYWPVEVRRVQGDVTPFLNHLAKVLPDERDRTILLSYMAACVQYKGVKFQWAPVIQGVEGNGKTLFTRCVAEAVSRRYTHWPKASQLGSQFNSWMENRVFYGVEDVYVPGDNGEIFEELKPMITGDQLEIQGKGIDQRTVDDLCGNFMFNSNHKTKGLRKSANDRRIAPFYSAQQKASDLERDGMDGAYFPNLYNWLKADGYAIVAEFLHTWAIPDEFNPAGECQKAPITSATEQALVHGLGGIEQEVQEAIEQGLPGFAGGWVSSMMLDRLLERLGATRRIPLNARTELMSSLGYELHPGLPSGRVTSLVMPDVGRPRLYIINGHPTQMLRDFGRIAHAYSQAQEPGKVVNSY